MDTSWERYLFSNNKTKSMTIKRNNVHLLEEDGSLKLNSKILETSNERESNLGIHQTDTTVDDETTKACISSAHLVPYALMGAGLHNCKGINHTTPKRLLEIYVTPVLLSSLEALCLTTSEIKQLEEYYQNMLNKSITCRPQQQTQQFICC